MPPMMTGAELAAIRSPLTGPADTAGGPTPRFVGDLWYPTTTANGFVGNVLYEHNGTAWILASGSYLLQDTLLAGVATQILFSAIPAGCKALQLLIQARGDGAVVADVVQLQFNGDTGSNYDSQFVRGANATASANSAAGIGFVPVGIMPGASVTRGAIAASLNVWVPNYGSTTFEKSTNSTGGFVDSTAANNIAETRVGSWRNTAAITAIRLFPGSSTNFVAGTRATLYGLA